MGALTKNKCEYKWWERIQKVHTLLNTEELPVKWADAQKLRRVSESIKKTSAQRARREGPPQCNNCGRTEYTDEMVKFFRFRGSCRRLSNLSLIPT